MISLILKQSKQGDNIMNKVERILHDFSGEIYNLCYELLDMTDTPADVFEYTCKNFKEKPKNGTIQIADYFSKEEIEEYESLFGETVDGLLDSTIKKCNFGIMKPEMFYKNLWESYQKNFETKKERAFAFYYTVADAAIPYCYLGKPLSMSNEKFKSLVQKNKDSIDKIEYINKTTYGQRTERASLALNIISEIPDYEDKVVVLAQAITILGTGKKEKIIPPDMVDDLIKSIKMPEED
mgnify:CR=1 FL=1